MKFLKTFIAAILSAGIIYAPQIASIIPPKYELYCYGVLFLYEVGARLYPTTKNISLLSQFILFIQTILPNNSNNVPHE